MLRPRIGHSQWSREKLALRSNRECPREIHRAAGRRSRLIDRGLQRSIGRLPTESRRRTKPYDPVGSTTSMRGWLPGVLRIELIDGDAVEYIGAAVCLGWIAVRKRRSIENGRHPPGGVGAADNRDVFTPGSERFQRIREFELGSLLRGSPIMSAGGVQSAAGRGSLQRRLRRNHASSRGSARGRARCAQHRTPRKMLLRDKHRRTRYCRSIDGLFGLTVCLPATIAVRLI
jgi:hypothetical protein